MDERPTLTTERLVLRPYRADDADEVRRIAGNRAIADTTLRIPHPYGEGVAEGFIAQVAQLSGAGRGAYFAVTLTDGGELIGGVGLAIDPDHAKGELGYHIAVEHWGRGFASEAAGAVVDYAFDVRGLNRVDAHHMTRNPASGRILERIGMHHEGTLRQYILKWGVPEDVEIWAILAGDR